MTTTERDRHDLYQRLDEVLGHDQASTLMDLLPPSGWGDVARRSDLEALRHELRADLAALELRLERSIRSSLHANLGVTAALAAAIVAAIQL